MRAIVKRNANAVLAVVVSLLCAVSLLGTPATALAEGTENNTAEKQLTISGVDFMEPTATGWELLRVDNGAGKTVYIDIKQGDKYLMHRAEYAIPEANPNEDGKDKDKDYMGSGSQVAQIIAVNSWLKDENDKPAQLQDLMEGMTSGGSGITITVWDSAREGAELFDGAIYPVYAKLIDGQEAVEGVSYVVQPLGIRTVANNDQPIKKNIGVASTAYTDMDDPGHATTYQLKQEKGAPDVVYSEDDSAYVATYTKAEKGAVSGGIKYVDLEGNVLDKNTQSVVVPEKGIDVTFEKSFFVGNDYYRVIQNLTGTTVTLTPQQPTKQIRVKKVDGMEADAFQVHVKYVDENSKVLWTDDVDVKGEGYQYTLPTTFSTKAQSGVSFYTLSGVKGEESSGDTAEGDQAAARSAHGWTNPVKLDAAARDAMTKNDDGTYTLTAQYESQEADKTVTLTVVEVNGETGQVIDRVKHTVTEGEPATYKIKNDLTVDGQKLVPWSGNTEDITYEWADLQKGTDLLQYVYYVSEGYTPGDAYDITVQYMNIANSQVIRTQTITVDPEITDFVNILGEERFVEGGNEYVRLNGQETAIRHAYFTPTRTYTVYYRDVNDVLNSQITVQRTQIIETERVVNVPGTTVISAAPAVTTVDGATAPAGAAPAGAAPAGAAPTVDAGVGAGDGTTIINDDDNPLASPDGTTTTEERIEDDATALTSGLQDGIEDGMNVVAGVSMGITAVALIGLAILVATRLRRKNATDNGSINR